MTQAITPIDAAVAEDRTKRIELTQATLTRFELVLQVEADMPFWLRRIRRACKRKANYTTNRWSFRGSVSERYQQELSRRLGPIFTVDRTYYTGPLDLMEPCVVVTW